VTHKPPGLELGEFNKVNLPRHWQNVIEEIQVLKQKMARSDERAILLI
jgi:hypothetical protein